MLVPEDPVAKHYKTYLGEDSQQSVAVATLKTLMKVLENDQSKTVVQLRENVRGAIETLKQIESYIRIESVAEIFLRFITLDVSRYDNFTELKKALFHRSNLFLHNRVIQAKGRVAKTANKFISDQTRILVHSRSMAAFVCLKDAHDSKKNFFVYVTESRPDQSGVSMCSMLTSAGIKNQLITDASIGSYLEKVDMVMVGAEGVCESGGILNKVGTFPLAICAKALNKPFYVVAESYKFVRMYPLNQADILARVHCRPNQESPASDEYSHARPYVDYTPPEYITLILTDLGPLTTAAISDELMKLYL